MTRPKDSPRKCPECGSTRTIVMNGEFRCKNCRYTNVQGPHPLEFKRYKRKEEP